MRARVRAQVGGRGISREGLDRVCVFRCVNCVNQPFLFSIFPFSREKGERAGEVARSLSTRQLSFAASLPPSERRCVSPRAFPPPLPCAYLCPGSCRGGGLPGGGGARAGRQGCHERACARRRGRQRRRALSLSGGAPARRLRHAHARLAPASGWRLHGLSLHACKA